MKLALILQFILFPALCYVKPVIWIKQPAIRLGCKGQALVIPLDGEGAWHVNLELKSPARYMQVVYPARVVRGFSGQLRFPRPIGAWLFLSFYRRNWMRDGAVE